MKRLFFCLCLMTGIVIGSQQAWSGISISPAYVEVSLERGRASGQFVISNTGDKEERYRIMASHFNMGVKGGMKKVEPDENSLVPWLIFNPKEFSLQPKSRRVVRFVIVPRGKTADQEYWGFMELKSLKANVAKAKDAAGRTMKIEMIPSILVPIFATKGDIDYGAKIQQVGFTPDREGVDIEAIIANTGKGHLLINGEFKVIDNSGQTVYEGVLGKNYVFPGNSQRLHSSISEEIPSGDYTVEIICRAPQLKEPISYSARNTWQ